MPVSTKGSEAQDQTEEMPTFEVGESGMVELLRTARGVEGMPAPGVWWQKSTVFQGRGWSIAADSLCFLR